MRTCWQIRRDLLLTLAVDERQGDADLESMGGASQAEWRIECELCPVSTTSVPCWEQCSGADCCCAPIHVTCDFCTLYIEHRREIARLVQSEPVSSDAGSSTHAGENRPPRSHTHSTGGTSITMERLQLSVPDMYADHHVLRARSALTALAGVQDVTASSAFRVITLNYDPAATSPGAIMAELEGAGYPVATNGTGVIARTVPFTDGHRDPAWVRLGMRQTKTDERDLKTQR